MAFHIDGDRVENLIEAIEETTKMQTADISGVEIPEKDALQVGTILGLNRYLKSVKLSFSGDARGMYALFEPLLQTITSLTITHTHLDSRAIIALSDALVINETLQVLELVHVRLPDNIRPLLEAIGASTTLETVDLSSNNGSVRGGIIVLARALADNKSITTLKLNDCRLERDAGRLDALLSSNQTLTHLELRENGITDETITRLVPSLSANTTLTSLNLGMNRIEADGVVALAEMLKANTTLETLDISGNVIGTAGWTALGSALSANRTLRVLNVARGRYKAPTKHLPAWVGVGGEGLDVLGNVFRQQEPEDTVVFALSLGFNEGLQKLDLSGNNGMDVIALATGLSTNTTLQELDLSNCGVTIAGVRALGPVVAKNTTLTSLKVSNNYRGIGDTGVVALLAGGTHIQTLALCDCNIGDEGLQTITRCLPTLQSLSISRTTAPTVTWRRFIDILATSQLTHCDLSHCNFDDGIVQQLADVLRTNTTLVSLDISNSGITDDGVRALAAVLKTNSTLKSLNISDYFLTDNCLAALEEMLRYNVTIQVVDVRFAFGIDYDNPLLHTIEQHLLRNKRINESDTKPARAIAMGPQPPF